MNKELPNYVFEKAYDKFYLLTEFDIIFNRSFTQKFDVFLKRMKFNKLLVELQLPSSYKLKGKNIIEVDTAYKLDDFFNEELLVNDSKIPLFMINLFIRDTSKLWEIYVSSEHELSIIGCHEVVSPLVEETINPYKEEDLDKKIKIIGDMFNDKSEKDIFFDRLSTNYNFT